MIAVMSALSPEAQFQLRRAERLLAERDERRTRLRGQAIVAARLLQQLGATRVWIFGSLDRPWFHAGSDVDLAVEGIDPRRLTEAWRRVEEIIEAPVDLVSMEDVDERLRQRILQTGTLVS